jgi:putative cell wall-binding protein
LRAGAVIPGVPAALAVIAALLTFGASPAEAQEAVTPARVEGVDRFDTAARIAEETFTPETTTTALIARGDDFPDALAGSGPAGAHEAPILLVEHDHVPARTHEALEALTVTDVLILGGSEAVSSAVEDELRGAYDVERLAGATRYETAAAIAAHVAATTTLGVISGDTAALLVSGEVFADAVTAGPLAYSGNVPILLTLPDALPDATAEALVDIGIERVVVLGGTAAVSETVVAELGNLGITVERTAGERRTDTAARFARRLVDTWGYDVSTPMLATGANFPDALAAGPRGGALERPILLTRDARSLSMETAQWLGGRCPDVETVQAVGGTAAVRAAALDAAVTAAGSCHADPVELHSFSTPLTPGQPRNHNIHLAADYIDGAVIAPGSTFSLNAAIGPRTSARGFIENGFIDEGEIVSVVGGGVSQLATTFVNAAWFAGVQIDAFRQHTIYFERYPMCREATLAWNQLDVVITNDTPQPLTVATAYTDSRVTVSLLGFPWGEASTWTGDPYAVEGLGGAFSVDCGRTITYPDGTSSSFSYTWRYREGYPG